MYNDKIIIKGLKLFAYHGVNPEEKIEGQDFILDIECYLPLNTPCVSDNVDDTVSYAKIVKLVRNIFTAEKYDLIEKAAQMVCDGILGEFEKIEKVTVDLKKPNAPIKADFSYVSVKIERERAVKREARTAVLGLGTNLGDKKENLKNAIAALSNLTKTRITSFSNVYETEPWGNTDQDSFLNMCIEIETELSPNALLGACLGIESVMGRERPFKYAPRIIDIDVLLYEGEEIKSEELSIPHPLIGDRAFVLVPLKDILKNLKFGSHNYNDYYNYIDKDTVKLRRDITFKTTEI